MGGFVSDSPIDLTGRLFAWPFRAEVADGLRWDDLLNTAPATLVLTKDGLAAVAAKTKTRGDLKVDNGEPPISLF